MLLTIREQQRGCQWDGPEQKSSSRPQMELHAIRLIRTATLFTAVICAGTLLLGDSSGPTPGLTGDFGEPDCRKCHSGTLNPDRTHLSIVSPSRYIAGQKYDMSVKLASSYERSYFGFQLSVRFAKSGKQAGELIPKDKNTKISRSAAGIQYISHTRESFGPMFDPAIWEFTWTAPAVSVESIRFSAAGIVANSLSSPTLSGGITNSTNCHPESAITAIFPHVAAGGGYTTQFAVTNVAAQAAAVDLELTGSDGFRMYGRLLPSYCPDSDADGGHGSGNSSMQLDIPPGGTRFACMTAAKPDPVTGWARLTSLGGRIEGVATTRFYENGVLKTSIGTLAASAGQSATIAMDDDGASGRFTGYAVANPGEQFVDVRRYFVDSSGKVVKEVSPVLRLQPGQHFAGFAWQDFNDPALNFLGSIVLKTRSGSFSATGLLQEQGIFTATPVVARSAPAIGE
jgi:hypothetical protein